MSAQKRRGRLTRGQAAWLWFVFVLAVACGAWLGYLIVLVIRMAVAR